MRARFLTIFFLLLSSAAAFPQGSVSTGPPVAVNASGQPLANTLVAICSANPGTATPPCTGTLATTYTDITLGHACSGAAGTEPLNNDPAPSLGSGCSNPGLTDSSGNVVAYASPGTYYCQYYGPNVLTYVKPCVFPSTTLVTSFSSPPAIGNVAPNTGAFTTLNSQRVGNVRFADQFSGSDCGAKINAADADLGAATNGEIWVNSLCGTTITTQPQSIANAGVFHTLRFIQDGTYTFNVSSPTGNIVIYSPNAPASSGAPGGGFVIKGTGAGTVLRFLGTATYAYNIPCGSSPEHFKIDLTGATSFNGITSGGSSSAHCQFTNVNDVRVNAGNGIGFNPGCFNDYWTITGLWVTNVTNNDGAWIGCLSTNMNIVASHFNSNGGNGLDLGGCSQCKVVASEMIGNGTLGGSCSGFDRAGIFIAADNTSNGSGIGNVANEIVVAGNYIARNWTYGIQYVDLASGTINSSTVTGNDITANGQCSPGAGGVEIVANNANVTFSNHLIKANNIHDNTGWGIQLVSSGGTFTNYVNNDILENTYLNNSSGVYSIDNYTGILGSFVHYETATPSNALLQDVCYGDSTLHGVKCSYNGKNFHPAPVIEQGSCAMSSGTSCTFSIGASFTTATTYVSLDAASTPPGTAISAKCSVSGTTVTITAGSSNSLTWDCVIVGNPS